jgi:hypothetical protein
LHQYDTNIATVLQNYEKAYSHTVADKMFLLDVKQLHRVYENAGILGADYWKAKPTQKAVDKASFKSLLSTENY